MNTLAFDVVPTVSWQVAVGLTVAVCVAVFMAGAWLMDRLEDRSLRRKVAPRLDHRIPAIERELLGDDWLDAVAPVKHERVSDGVGCVERVSSAERAFYEDGPYS